jgi:hypothetical protein
MAKAVNVVFPSGRELLGAYWGLLANGGLVLSEGQNLHEGDNVALEVLIESSQQRYNLSGQVVRRPSAQGGERVVIAFDPGEPQDLLLSAAWAETDNVPARRHRRFPVEADVTLMGVGQEVNGRLVNLSLGGCCVRASGGGPKVGEEVRVVGKGGDLTGVVRWVRGSCRGVEFRTDPGSVETFVKKLI